MFFTLKFKRSAVLCVIMAVMFVAGAMCVSALAAESEKVNLPVIMYHSVLKDEKRLGKYVISPDEFEKDLKYLKDNGYTTVSLEELVAYTKKNGDLPEKPVLLTFDDGYYNNYYYAYPIARQYNAKIVISPIGYYSDEYSKEEKLSPYYSHITWDQITEMSQSGLVEFGNHTYNLHKSDGARMGAKRLAGEDADRYKQMLTEDVHEIQDKLTAATNKAPLCFAYPFGAISKDTPEIIKSMGFSVTLTCESHMNTVTKDPESLFDLGRYLRTQNQSIEKIFNQ